MKHRTGIFAKTKTMMLMSIRVFLGLMLFVGLVSGKPADKPLVLKGSVAMVPRCSRVARLLFLPS